MGRFLCVSINQQRSMFLPLLCGVPQGSRPMVYLIYVDDLPHSIKYSHTLIFAMDSSAFYQLHLARTVLISKIISMKSHIVYSMAFLFQEIYRPNIFTQHNSSIYILKLRNMQILELY